MFVNTQYLLMETNGLEQSAVSVVDAFRRLRSDTHPRLCYCKRSVSALKNGVSARCLRKFFGPSASSGVWNAAETANRCVLNALFGSFAMASAIALHSAGDHGLMGRVDVRWKRLDAKLSSAFDGFVHSGADCRHGTATFNTRTMWTAWPRKADKRNKSCGEIVSAAAKAAYSPKL